MSIRLSKTEKMPGASYSLPAKTACPVGSRIAKDPDSVCSKCYACKGRYLFKNVQDLRKENFQDIQEAERSGSYVDWIEGMVKAIEEDGTIWFRFHDSGDVQSKEHYEAICEVARRLPGIRFWLPTKEHWLAGQNVPSNLCVRFSGLMIDEDCDLGNYAGLPTSLVSRKKELAGFQCPAPKQEGKCKDCRACWDKDVPTVVYHYH